ncbi:TetR/AcrR family transcriptional regulator [Thalassotalea montiporae]
MVSGRKREFDEQVALQAAMEVFWQKGYSGTSLSDLTSRMGINKPSLYSAFGNKESLFIKATQLYINSKMKPHLEILNNPSLSLFDRLKQYLMSIINQQCCVNSPKGCYLVQCQSEIVGGDLPAQASAVLATAESIPKQVFTELFQHDREAVSLNLANQAEQIALTLYTMLKGTAAMARSGVEANELEVVVDTCLSGLGLTRPE